MFRIVEEHDEDVGETLTCLYHRQQFIAGWKQTQIPHDIMWLVSNMLNEAFERGQQVRSKQIKALLDGCSTSTIQSLE